MAFFALACGRAPDTPKVCLGPVKSPLLESMYCGTLHSYELSCCPGPSLRLWCSACALRWALCGSW